MLFRSLRLGLDWLYRARNYSDFALSTSDLSMDGEKQYETPWKIPAYCLFDFSAGYTFEIGGLKTTVSGGAFMYFIRYMIIENVLVLRICA